MVFWSIVLVLQFAFGMWIVKGNVCPAMESAWKITEQFDMIFCFLMCVLFSVV